MAQGVWDVSKMLDVYIHDYLRKRNLVATAETFMTEGNVEQDPVALDVPGGFLFEWWSVFWDIFIARNRIEEQHSGVTASSLESQKAKDQPQVQQYQPAQRQDQLQGINKGGMPLKGWPLTESIDQLRSSLSPQVQKPLVTSGNQFQLMMPHQQQQILAQAQAQAPGNIVISHEFGEVDPQRVGALPRGGLSAEGGQSSGDDESIGSSMQSASPVIRDDQTEYNMKKHQLQQNNRKRKTTSGPANSTATGNTVGPSTSPPSTPSSNTPGDRVAMCGNLPHSGTMAKNSVMFTDASGGLLSSSNLMDDMEHFGDIGVLDENLNFIHDSVRCMFAPGLTFLSKSTSNNKVLCCHFSSDGKILASAGHEKKVLIWNIENGDTYYSSEEHTDIITDIRFRPDSTQLATSSFDRTVRLWNATEPSFSLHMFTGHNSQVTSLDFHPKKTNILCSCDASGEMRVWNVGQPLGVLYSKGGSRQVRFQPGTGQFLAAAAENVVSIFDFDAKRKAHTLQGHSKEVLSVSWDAEGEYLASVSHDAVKVWSASGEHIHELKSTWDSFYSCVFHPTFPKLLFIGGYQSMQLWDFSENKTMSITAHEDLITSLAQALTGTGPLIASASHDKSVKLWKYI